MKGKVKRKTAHLKKTPAVPLPDADRPGPDIAVVPTASETPFDGHLPTRRVLEDAHQAIFQRPAEACPYARV
ncbi:MAG: hypothetical protein EXS51_03115 [Candidatus Taylorbacteria bacterium]|nr:hypothetical protein [Candidatus Taylorbacteria bacterium]